MDKNMAIKLLPPYSGWSTGMIQNQHLQTIGDKSRAVMDSAVEEHKTEAFFALFSGGHDSLTVTHVASKHPLFRGVIHIDTGTGLPETRAFVEDTCKREGWPLIVKKPATTYEMLIVRYGFPGPSAHQHMYKYLKERPLGEAKKEAHKVAKTKKFAFVGGMRSQESVRRMGHVEPLHKDGMGVWVSAIHDWSATDCNQHMKASNLPRNPVKDTMHLSGECFCGAFARPEEKRELEVWYPDHAKKIEAWQELVRTAVRLGLSSIPFNHQQWGHGSSGSKMKAVPEGQKELPSLQMCFFCRGDAA